MNLIIFSPCEPWWNQGIFCPSLIPISPGLNGTFHSLSSYSSFLEAGRKVRNAKPSIFWNYTKKNPKQCVPFPLVTIESHLWALACSVLKGLWVFNIELTDIVDSFIALINPVDSYIALTNPVDSYVELTNPTATECTEMRKEGLNPCLIFQVPRWWRKKRGTRKRQMLEELLAGCPRLDLVAECNQKSAFCAKMSPVLLFHCSCLVASEGNPIIFKKNLVLGPLWGSELWI